MKKFVILSIFSLITAINFSCKKIAQAVFPSTDANAPDITLTIPAFPIVPNGTVDLGTFTSHFNLDSAIRANTNNVFNISAVTSVSLKQIVFNLSNGTSVNNLSNLQSLNFQIASNSNINYVTVADITFPSTETYTYTYTPSNAVELISYFQGTDFTYKASGQLRKPTTSSMNLTISITMHIK